MAGGITNDYGSLTITNSTVSANHAQGNGGYLDPSQWKPSPAIAARIYNETGEIYQAIGNWQNAGNNFSRALACFVLARAIAHELAGDNEEELPWVVLRELRLLLGEEALQLLQHDIEARAEQVIEQALIS